MALELVAHDLEVFGLSVALEPCDTVNTKRIQISSVSRHSREQGSCWKFTVFVQTTIQLQRANQARLPNVARRLRAAQQKSKECQRTLGLVWFTEARRLGGGIAF